MAESNKILTVSYGTFSCTLEGFDDAFTTMKAIAEYFRDLAADDRFFGAEPPTPDPELLTRLASRAAARRVEARHSENGLHLRQDAEALPEPQAAAPRAAAPAPAAVAAPVAEDVEDDEAGYAAEDAAEDIADDIAADDDTQAPEVEAEAADDIDDDIDAVAEDADDVAPDAAPAKSAPVARPIHARSVQASAPAGRVQASRSRVRVATTGARPVRVSAARTERPFADPSSVAAKLQRIRDVVAKDRAATADFSEDQHADESDFEADDALLGNVSDADNAPIENAADLPVIDPAAAASVDAAVAAFGRELSESDDEDADEWDADHSWMATSYEDVEEDDEDEERALSAAMAIANAAGAAARDMDDVAADDVAEDDTDDLSDLADLIDDASADDMDDDQDDAPLDARDADDLDEDDRDDLAAAAPAPQQPEAPRPARPVARVLKVKRRDLDAAVADGALEEDDDDQPAAPARSYGDSSLSPEDEAELQNELRALEDEIAGRKARDTAAPAKVEAFDADDEDDADADDVAAIGAPDGWDDEDDLDDEEALDAIADAGPASTPVNPRRRLMERADTDMDRILAETNNQLGDSDSTRRRSAIAHLRAAVAATKAEKQAGADFGDDSHERADAYRDDLAQVVRPRRPAPRAEGPARRAEDRPAPLKLVAEQRVDLPESQSVGPVRPRRVRVADLALREEMADRSGDDMDHDAAAHARAAAANAASFTEFAERVGAYQLPDILEAAASYLAFVEGREEFTRPQLMGKARQALADEFSREDGLRHFGRLLREGKLRKVAAGQFTVSDRINFRPEERIAG